MNEQKDGLTMLDEYGQRKSLIPAEVRGRFHLRRQVLHYVLLVISLIAPWLSINGNQVILIDIVHRKFIFFGYQFWSHDGPLIFFILAILTLSLALATALFGRVWCGWACPQTVFIETVYRQIEKWVEGNYLDRRKMETAPLTLSILLKRSLKWGLFLLVSSIISHSFIAYFVGSTELISMIEGGPQTSWSYFLLVTISTGILLFNFGWFREQFCLIMCPYGRFQSVLHDKHSVTVLYDADRGEPRKGSPEALASGRTGDCVACKRCVQVCPTGIDIRNGVQMECIACTACIDACDEIMEKVNQPRGLIRYSSLAKKTRWIRPRVVIYSAFLTASFGGLVTSLGNRDPFLVTVLRAKETPYQILTQGNDETIMNHYKLHLHNQSEMEQEFELQPDPAMTQSGLKLTIPPGATKVPRLKDKTVHFFVLVPKSMMNGQSTLVVPIQIQEKSTKEITQHQITVLGPNDVNP